MPYLLSIFCLFFMCACGGRPHNQGTSSREQIAPAVKTEKTKYVNSIRLTSPEKNKLYDFHEEIVIAFENKDRFPVDSAEIYVNGKKVARLDSGVYRYTYPIPAQKAGTTTVKVVASHPNQRKGVATVSIRVKPDKAPQLYKYQVVHSFPHDPRAYTQGLIYHKGYLYEGTGQYGESSLRKTDIQTGKTLSLLSLEDQLFGEGITIYKDKIYQLTWQSRKGFVYDLNTFSLASTFTYNTQGWGLTTVGDSLVMSDGSHKLYYLSPTTFNILREVEVYDHQGEVTQLNELEYVDGQIWANVWLTDRIIAINPQTGAVEREVNLGDILPPAEKAKLNKNDEVLNGIAYRPEQGTFYVTGKRWQKMFEIQIIP